MIMDTAVERKSVYIANPNGFSESGRYWLANVLIPKLAGAGFDVINPFMEIMHQDTAVLRDSAMDMTHEVAMAIGARNFAGIDRSHMVFAVLDGTDVDSGTAAEIGYATAKGKQVVGFRGDFRSAADSDSCVVNLQVQHAVERSGGHVHTGLDNAIEELVRLGLGRSGNARRTTA